MQPMAARDAGGKLGGWSCCFSLVNNTERASTALPPHYPRSPPPRQMMLRKRHSSRGQSLSQLSNRSWPDNLRLRGIYRVSCAATQGGSRSASQPASRLVNTFWFSLPSRISCLLHPQHLEVHPQTCRHLKAGSGQMVAPVTLCPTLSLNKQQQQRRLPTTPTKPLISPADTCPLKGSDWTACRAA